MIYLKNMDEKRELVDQSNNNLSSDTTNSNIDNKILETNNPNKFQNQFLLKCNLKRYLAKDENIFFKKLNEHKLQKYKLNKINKDEKFVLNYYLGNLDGMAGKKLNNFLGSNICY